ncbi:MAG TPA: carboxypeptidase regulatory-like domain-containing protein [Bryobacteraceae bacterium]|nr:carboxypeptidase regulatory-like domain-containing protein [Bryobacteraceae bacterium]
MKHLRVMCAMLALCLATCASLYAQAVTGTVLGTVTDSSGAVVQNAKVTLTEVNTGIAHTTQSNASGNYTFPDLPEGNYSVTVESTGFKKETRANVRLEINTSARVDVTLQPGAISESVVVTAEPPPLQTDKADTGLSLSSVQTASLPLGVNRNFQSLLNLVPGTTPATFQHSQFFNASSSLQTEVNGQMRMGNEYQIEGIDDDERTGLLQILVPPADAIQTVDVSTSNYDAEMGRASGGVANVILKSGTNSFHGDAYEYLQNSYFDARAFFNPTVPHIAYNYFGGSVGGPIIKNKLFFFFDYLRAEDHEATGTQETIPSLTTRTGDLSVGLTLKTPDIVYDPASGDTKDCLAGGNGNLCGAGRVPFVGNKIPVNRINTVSAAILNLLPAPNELFNEAAPSNNYFAAPPFSKTTNSFDTKVDYNITEKDRLSGRLSFADPKIYQAPIFGSFLGGNANGAFQGTGVQRTYSSGLNYDHVFSPNLIAEFRFGVAYYNSSALPSDYKSTDAQKLGVPGVNISDFTSGQVSINLNGNFTNPLIGYSASLPWVRSEANIDFDNTWTKIIGNHTLKFGFDLRRVRDNLLQDQVFGSRGVYGFGANQTALPTVNCATTACPAGITSSTASATNFLNNIASFLLDDPGGSNATGRDVNTYFPAYRQWWFFPYVGDRWVVTPKLTLTMGLRWEFYPPATPQFPGGFSNYIPSTNQLVIAGVGGNPQNMGMKTSYRYFAPRLGAAYRLTNSTVIRTGFGISYTPFPDNTYAYNYPVRSNNAYNSLGNGYGPVVLSDGVTPATFQAGFPGPVPVTIPSNGIIPSTGALNNQNYFYIPLDYLNPYVESWNFSVQQSLPLHFTLDAAYVGNHGVRIPGQYNLNAGVIPGAGTAGQPEFTQIDPNTGQQEKRTATTTEFWQGFSSSYNALQVKANRAFTAGLLITTSFTWGKGMNYQTGDDGAYDFYYQFQRNYARTDFDRKYTYVQSFVYELPFGVGKKYMTSGWGAKALGNWELSGILSAYSGTPLTITANGGTVSLPGANIGNTADQVAPVQILWGINTGNPYFSTSSFVQPTGVRYGTSGRNIFDGPGLFQFNLSLAKSFQFTERMGLQLRCDSFNFTNTPEFSNPNTSVTAGASFGTITGTLGSGSGVNGTGGGRSLQLAAKFSF